MTDLLKKITMINWLHPGIRSRLMRKFHKNNLDFSVPFFGLNYTGNTSSYIDRFVYYIGAYEIGILNLIENLANEYKIKNYIDIGGNVGHHALFASTVINKVDSFEPYPKVLSQFYKNIKINNIDNITIHEFGLGKRDEVLEYFEPEGANLGTGSFVSDYSSNNRPSGLKLEIKEGNFLKTLDFNSAIIKIDTEGFESLVFEGIKEVLIERPCILIVEVSNFDTFSADSKKFILDHYKVSLIKNQFKQNVELQEVSQLEGKEIYFLLIDKRLLN